MSRDYNAAPKFIDDCFLCKSSFQFGSHVYDGRRIPSWNIMICKTCDDGNFDGVVLGSHPDLVHHLEEQGIKITLNQKGWLDLPKRGGV